MGGGLVDLTHGCWGAWRTSATWCGSTPRRGQVPHTQRQCAAYIVALREPSNGDHTHVRAHRSAEGAWLHRYRPAWRVPCRTARKTVPSRPELSRATPESTVRDRSTLQCPSAALDPQRHARLTLRVIDIGNLCNPRPVPETRLAPGGCSVASSRPAGTLGQLLLGHRG